MSLKSNLDVLLRDLSKRDEVLADLEAEMYAKRFLLIQKKKALDNSVKQNNHHHAVLADYNKFYDHIIKQNEEQQKVLEYINRYIGDIMDEGSMTDTQIQESKMQQEQILKEILKIKDNLDDIIGTNISSTEKIIPDA